MIYTLIKNDYIIPLLYDNGIISCECNTTDSRPMIERKVKIHKGVDNQIKFQVLDSDRRKIPVNQMNVVATLVDTHTEERVMKKPCRVLELAKGQLVLSLFEGDLHDIAPGNYELVITGQQNFIPGIPGDQASTPFYSDTAANIRLFAEVIDSVDKTPPQSIEQTEFVQDYLTIENAPVPAFFTSSFPGHRTKNLKNMIHTIAVTPVIDELGAGYKGLLRITGSLDHVPPQGYGTWFSIAPEDYRDHKKPPINPEVVTPSDVYEDIYFENLTETVYFTFNTNSLWIKCAFMPELNSLDPESLPMLSKISYL